MSVLRVSKLSILGNKKLRVSKLSLSGTNTNPVLRVSKLSLSGTPPVALQPFSDQTVDAYTTVTLTAVVTSGSPQPTSYTWRQISGPTTTYTDNGTSITFATLPAWAGMTLVYGVTANYGSSSSPEITATVNVNPHLYWFASNAGNVWVPQQVPTSRL